MRRWLILSFVVTLWCANSDAAEQASAFPEDIERFSCPVTNTLSSEGLKKAKEIRAKAAKICLACIGKECALRIWPEEKKLEIVAAITEAFNDHESSTIDGVRVRFTEDGEQQGWYLARKSNTEAILVMRVEAVNEEKLSQMLNLIDSRVSSIINIEKLLA